MNLNHLCPSCNNFEKSRKGHCLEMLMIFMSYRMNNQSYFSGEGKIFFFFKLLMRGFLLIVSNSEFKIQNIFLNSKID